ncbi:MAG: tRNA nucleotidyl transferase [Deltaproteobacteria bacterium]|nr:MAG: tRNA nucleotidyl transferase [Deltaproteobacteria bacterium]
MEIVLTHKNADFDALASLVAASMVYPESKPVLPKALNANVKAFLSIHKDVFSFQESPSSLTSRIRRLIVVDTNSWSRIEGGSRFLAHEPEDIHVWDHHGRGDIKASFERQEPVGATCTLFIEHMAHEGIDLSPIHATLFLAAIHEDTGSLMFPSTTARDAKAVGYLLEHKGDLGIIKNFLRPAYGPKQKEILFELLKNATRSKVSGYTVSINKLLIEGHTPGLAIVVDMLRDILNVDAVFGIFNEPKRNRTMVIGRSAVEGLNMGMIMRAMGGGGHPGAGSCLLREANPDAIEDWIRELISGNQFSSVRIRDLMSFPVFTVNADETMQSAANLLKEKGCTGLPVMEGDRLVGIISRRDFRKLKNDSQLSLPVKAFMSQKIVSIEPEKGIMEAARLMVKYDVGRLPVLKDGKLIGIVTRSDTMRYFYDVLPE